jgi:hypothetical protein
MTILAEAPETLVCCGYCGGEGTIRESVFVSESGFDVDEKPCPECGGSPLAIVPHRGDKIVTNYWRKPGGCNHFDWSARFDDDEPDDDGHMLQGWGSTESIAIEDLLRLAQEAAECSNER